MRQATTARQPPTLTILYMYWIVRVGGCPAVVAQWETTGGSSQKCPGFDSRRLPAFLTFPSIFTSLHPDSFMHKMVQLQPQFDAMIDIIIMNHVYINCLGNFDVGWLIDWQADTTQCAMLGYNSLHTSCIHMQMNTGSISCLLTEEGEVKEELKMKLDSVCH